MLPGEVAKKVNLDDALAAVSEHWAPPTVAELNDYDIRLVKVAGAFVWHAHPETDELFLVLAGRLRIDFRGGAVELGPRELYVVPRGVEHRPVADEEAHVLLVEPSATVNTGTAGGARTAPRRLL
jgi:mannose-6-phosphate isomerase-like protein (cupin superfamily)